MSETYTIENCEVMAVTLRAVLYKIDDEEHWIPRSQIEDDSVILVGEMGDVTLASWLAEKLELV